MHKGHGQCHQPRSPWYLTGLYEVRMSNMKLKLVRTNLNYRLHVLGTSTTANFLSNDNSLYASITSDECHAWFHLYGTSRPARSTSKATKYKMKNSCSPWDSNPQPWDLAWCSADWATRALVKTVFTDTCNSDTNVYIWIRSRMLK